MASADFLGGFAQAMGSAVQPELQAGVSALLGGGQAPAPAATMNPKPQPAQASSVAATQAPADNDQALAGTAAKITAALPGDTDSSVAAARNADDVAASFIQHVDTINGQRAKLLADSTTAKQSLVDQEGKLTQDTQAAVTPLFQKLQSVTDRKAELAQMNPFKRMFVETFSLSHNPDWLNEQEAALKDQIATHGQSYATLMGMSDRSLQAVNEHYESQDAMLRLGLENYSADARAAIQKSATSSQIVGTEIQGLEGAQHAIATAALARNDFISKLTPDQTNAYLAKAQANGGSVMVNGLTLNAGELQKQAMNWKDQQLALESRQVALQSGRLELARAQEEKYYSHLSVGQLEAINSAGKMPDGSAPNYELLTRGLVVAGQRTTQLALDAVNHSSEGVLGSSLYGLGNQVNMATQRATQIYGTLPPELATLSHQLTAQVNGMSASIADARAKGGDVAAAKAAQIALSQVAKLQDQFKKGITDQALKWAGGDKTLAEFNLAYLTGSPLNSETSAAALIHMARGNIPAGMKLSPVTQAVLAKIKPIVEQYDAGPGRSGMTMVGGKMIRKGMEDPALIQSILQNTNQAFSAAALHSTMGQLPELAAQIKGPDGKPHPFSQVSSHDLQAAIQLGDQDGLKKIASNLGITPQMAEMMFQQGEGGNTWKQYKASHKNADYGQTAQMYSQLQQNGMLYYLDHSPSAHPGFVPSLALGNLARNPDFQSMISSKVHALSQGTAGDFLAHSIAGNNFDNFFQGYMGQMSRSAAQNQQQFIRQSATTAQRLRSISPQDSAMAALSTIQGISPGDRSRLLGAVMPLATQMATQPGYAHAGPSSVSDAIDHVMLHQKFQDPALESIRQKAAKVWAERHPMMKTGFAGLLEGLQSFRDIGSNSAYLANPTQGR